MKLKIKNIIKTIKKTKLLASLIIFIGCVLTTANLYACAELLVNGAYSTTLPSDGESTVNVLVSYRLSSGAPWEGQPVTLSLSPDSGYLEESTLILNSSGFGWTVYHAGDKPDKVTLTAVFHEGTVRTANVYLFGAEIENDGQRDSENIQIQHKLDDDALPLNIYYTISPAEGFTPSNVALKILDANDIVTREQSLPVLAGEQSITWDGKDNNGEFVEYGNYKATIEVTAGNLTTISNEHPFIVYMVRLGNNVYRDLESFPFDEHVGLLYAYKGNKNMREELDNYSNYLVIEHPGKPGTTHVTDLDSFMAIAAYRDEWCPLDLTKEQRKDIVSTAFTLFSMHHPYTEDLLRILEFDGKKWDSSIADITTLRCDGVTEVSYEANGILLWGPNLMRNQGSLYRHYNRTLTRGCTPKRQRLGGGGDVTTNRQDSLYLPTE
ncbi:MAG: FlgD immunoglobulin-like domain containing protein [Candidatus Omnitrophota bacterium]